jgi:tRNA(Ile2) C34 agmatinyltransferase TiaS
MSDVCPKCKAEFESYVDDTWKKYKCGTRTLG